jgi:hypothetical protein
MSSRKAAIAVSLIWSLSIGAAHTTRGLAVAQIASGGRRDADVVLLLPAIQRSIAASERHALQPFLRWLRQKRLRYSLVPLSRILRTRPAETLTAEDVRKYLRLTFTWRPSTEDRPRYLGILAPPGPDYLGTPSTLPAIPRFDVAVGGISFTSDVPFEFLSPTTIDGGDGSVDPTDLDMTAPTFEVFRVPTGDPAGLETFAQRHLAFSAAPYRSDATLVAGEFGLFPGDTSVVQCINAANLEGQQLATRVSTVLDSSAASCAPDVLTTPDGPNLADFLADPAGAFRGGTIVDVSHGGPDALYGQTAAGFFDNLTIGDVSRIPVDRLNVLVSIACDNDAPDVQPNLAAAMWARASVAVVSATAPVTPLNPADILFAEVDSVTGLFQHRETLLQRLHVFRSEYYRQFVLTAAGADQQALWINVLTENLIGDGLVTVAR